MTMMMMSTRHVRVCICTRTLQILASCLILGAIAIERFIAVVCPLRHHTLSTARNAAVVILGCWGYAMVIGAMPLAGWNVVDAAAVSQVGASSAVRTSPNATVDNNTSTLQSPTSSSSSFADCRFDTVVGASYVAFLYPGHFVPLWVIMLVVYVQVYLHSRGRARRSRPLRHATHSVSVHHNVRRLSAAMPPTSSNHENATRST